MTKNLQKLLQLKPLSAYYDGLIFHQCNWKVLLEGIKNIILCQDDTYIGAYNKEELNKKTEQVLNKLKNAGMTIYSHKWKLNCEKILYLGYQISKRGIPLDDKLINKILEISTPKNEKELESFLGFHSKYLSRYSDLIEPFAELWRKNAEFKWTQRQNIAFKSLKKALRKLIVKIFNPKRKWHWLHMHLNMQ